MTFTVALPHVHRQDIDLSFVNGLLTLRAVFTVPDIASAGSLTGLFYRQFGLSEFADRANTGATFAAGMLRIVAPWKCDSEDYVGSVPIVGDITNDASPPESSQIWATFLNLWARVDTGDSVPAVRAI